jgi:hypothetical protein
VVGAAADLARDGKHGALAAGACRSLRVEAAIEAVGTLGVLSGFDERPPQHGCVVLGEVAAASCLARLVDDRIEARSTDRLTGRGGSARLRRARRAGDRRGSARHRRSSARRCNADRCGRSAAALSRARAVRSRAPRSIAGDDPTCARAAGDSDSDITQRRPSTVNSRARWHGHPSCVSSACSRCAQRMRSSASAFRNRV